MTAPRGLAAVRGIHTLIYLVMVGAIVAVLYAGVAGQRGPWLLVALAMLLAESLVFAGYGMKCPLTAVVAKYGAGQGEVSDTFLPARFTRHTLKIFGPLMAIGVALVAARWGLNLWADR